MTVSIFLLLLGALLLQGNDDVAAVEEDLSAAAAATVKRLERLEQELVKQRERWREERLQWAAERHGCFQEIQRHGKTLLSLRGDIQSLKDKFQFLHSRLSSLEGHWQPYGEGTPRPSSGPSRTALTAADVTTTIDHRTMNTWLTFYKRVNQRAGRGVPTRVDFLHNKTAQTLETKADLKVQPLNNTFNREVRELTQAVSTCQQALAKADSDLQSMNNAFTGTAHDAASEADAGEAAANVASQSLKEPEVRALIARIDSEVQTLNTRIDGEVHKLNAEIGVTVTVLNGKTDRELHGVNSRLEAEVDTLRSKMTTDVQSVNSKIDAEVQTVTDEAITNKQLLNAKINENVRALENKIDSDVKAVNDSANAEIQEARNWMSSLADDVSRSSITLQLQANTTEREIQTLAKKIDLEVETLNSKLTTTTQVLSSAVIAEAHEVKNKIGTVNASMQSMKDEMANVTNRFDTEIGDVRNRTDSDVQTLNIRLSSYVQVLGHKIDEQVQEMDRKIETKIQTVNNKMASYVQVLSDKNAVEVQTLQRIAMDQDLAIQRAASSTFVRWGNASCPPSAGVVYSGVAGGGLLSRQGSSPTVLCLPRNPTLADLPVPLQYSELHGAEYEVDRHEDQDVVCAVCRTPRPTAIMVPATDVCEDGWTLEYSGYLMGGSPNHASGHDYVCVDSSLEGRASSGSDDDGLLLLYVFTRCGSLKK